MDIFIGCFMCLFPDLCLYLVFINYELATKGDAPYAVFVVDYLSVIVIRICFTLTKCTLLEDTSRWRYLK